MTETEPTPPTEPSGRLRRALGRFAGEERIITHPDGSKTVGNVKVDASVASAFTPEGLRLMSAFHSEDGPVRLREWDGSDELPPSR